MIGIQRAAVAIAAAEAILIGCRSRVWASIAACPIFAATKVFGALIRRFAVARLSEMASPRWFRDDVALAWGFYGHRLNLYRATIPHTGFHTLLQMCADKSYFIYTSNVDGQFQKAGFDPTRIVECHGSIHHLQCTAVACCARHPEIWRADDANIAVDAATFRAREPLPQCPICGYVARPNILMFGDAIWLHERSLEQEKRFKAWKNNLRGKVVVIECGAGTAIPSVRYQAELLLEKHDATLIRINPRESDGPTGTISLATGALDGLQQISRLL